MADEWKDNDDAAMGGGFFGSLFGMPQLTEEQKAAVKRQREENAALASLAPSLLPPYRADARCSKCGHAKVKIKFCSTGAEYEPCFTKAGKCEHFHRTCKRCGYVWYEKVLPEADA